MEHILDEIGALVLPCLFLWLLFRFLLGLFFSPIVSRWFAHAMLVGYLSAVLISIGIIRIGLVDVRDLFSVLPYTFLISLNIIVMPLFYWRDKNKSNIKSAERIPELVLHSLAIFGGGIGALLSQAVFRHKTKKKSFQYLKWIAIATSMVVYYIALSKA